MCAVQKKARLDLCPPLYKVSTVTTVFAEHSVSARNCLAWPDRARDGFVTPMHDPHALYSMQEGALSSNSAEGLMKHGRASREAT